VHEYQASKPAGHVQDASPNTYINQTAKPTCCRCIAWHFKCTACYCVPCMADGYCCTHRPIWAHCLHACEEQAILHAHAVAQVASVESACTSIAVEGSCTSHATQDRGAGGRHASGNREIIQCQLCRRAACSAATAVSCCMSHCNTLPCQLLLTVVEACGTYKYKVASWQGYPTQ
jgi:hypothetical protein